MRRLIYVFLALSVVPIVKLASDSGSVVMEQQLGFVGTVGNFVDKDEEELTDEEIVEALESEDVSEEEEDPVLSSAEVEQEKVISEKKQALKSWRKTLTEEDKSIFRKLMAKRRKKKLTTDLGVKRAQKLLDKAKAKKAEKDKREQEYLERQSKYGEVQ